MRQQDHRVTDHNEDPEDNLHKISFGLLSALNGLFCVLDVFFLKAPFARRESCTDSSGIPHDANTELLKAFVLTLIFHAVLTIIWAMASQFTTAQDWTQLYEAQRQIIESDGPGFETKDLHLFLLYLLISLATFVISLIVTLLKNRLIVDGCLHDGIPKIWYSFWLWIPDAYFYVFILAAMLFVTLFFVITACDHAQQLYKAVRFKKAHEEDSVVLPA